MDKLFKNSDFKVGAGLSLRWIMCDNLNERYSGIKSMMDNVISWLDKGENVKPEWLRMCADEWMNLISVLDFLCSINVLDRDIFKTVTKDINNYIKLLNERL